MDISLPNKDGEPITFLKVRKWKSLFKHEFSDESDSRTFYLINFYPEYHRNDLIQTLTEDQYAELKQKTDFQETKLFNDRLEIGSMWIEADFKFFDESLWGKMIQPYL